MTKDIMANMPEHKVFLQMLHLYYNVASAIHDAVTPKTKGIGCSLDKYMYDKHTETVLAMDNDQQ